MKSERKVCDLQTTQGQRSSGGDNRQEANILFPLSLSVTVACNFNEE